MQYEYKTYIYFKDNNDYLLRHCGLGPLKFFISLFSNSLIIHKEKTKEITTVTVVWIPDLN